MARRWPIGYRPIAPPLLVELLPIARDHEVRDGEDHRCRRSGDLRYALLANIVPDMHHFRCSRIQSRSGGHRPASILGALGEQSDSGFLLRR